MNIPQELRYTKEHEWVLLDDGVVIVGVTDFAQSELGDVVYVELPAVGTALTAAEAFGNVVQEALASGVPAVVSDEGGCREIVEKSGAGLVIKARRADLFYEGCKLLTQDTGLYQWFRARGLVFTAERSWTKINGEVIDEYRRVRAAADGEKRGFKKLSGRRLQHG